MENTNNTSEGNARFEDFAFPVIKNGYAQLLGPQLATLDQMGLTMEKIIAGRPVKPFPYKYNDFNSLDDLKEYIRHTIKTSPVLEWEWLKVGNISFSILCAGLDTYYQSVLVVTVTCFKPHEGRGHSCMPEPRPGMRLMELNPNKWSLALVQEIIEKLKRENE